MQSRPDSLRRTTLDLLAILPTEAPAPDPRFLIEAARHAEALGYTGVRMPDHLLFPSGVGHDLGGVYDPLVVLASIAAVTDRITLGTSVLILPLRNPFAVAKQAATLAKISGNRFTLGVGVGWNREEFDATGADFHRRGHRTDEALRLIAHLHRVGHGPFESDTFGFTAGEFTPTLETPVPILVGGTSAAALRRAARFADIWEGYALDIDAFQDRVRHLRALSDRRITVGHNQDWTSDVSVDAFAGTVASWERAGADFLTIHFGSPDGMMERMASLIGTLRR